MGESYSEYMNRLTGGDYSSGGSSSGGDGSSSSNDDDVGVDLGYGSVTRERDDGLDYDDDSDSGGISTGGNTGGGGVIISDRNDDDENTTVTYDPTTGDDGGSDGTFSGGGDAVNVEIGDDGTISASDGDGFVTDDGIDADGDGSTTTSGGSSSNEQTPTMPEMPSIPTDALDDYRAQMQAQMQAFAQAMNARLDGLDADSLSVGGYSAGVVAAAVGLVVVLLGVLSTEA
ncbi:hypothetical protein SAMN04487947_0563 [Halogeometricum rufum]|uniref:Uncharacterized protein n=1 Tax=Halogeometricum rufum TaxID=553469 RepID=A0A1I6G4S5_9EURY|nr:hypothetical protein [Halogeometricum rufum]SFR37120.1 hypothetical protein SAMN04487947_0563 [Halogeometricum rufum]